MNERVLPIGTGGLSIVALVLMQSRGYFVSTLLRRFFVDRVPLVAGI
ncbi:MAG: hypothetical protein AB2693_34855 [Candidatus Thiodiazotropha sp.]